MAWEDNLKDVEFRNNVTHQLQQAPGILYPLAGSKGNGAGKSEVKIEDRFGQMTLRKKTAQNGDTDHSDFDAIRRFVKKPGSYDDAILIGRDQANSTSVAIGSPAVVAAANAIRKYHDDMFLKGWWGSGWQGVETATTEVPFTAGNKVASDFGSTGTPSGLTLGKLIELKRLLQKANVNFKQESPIILLDADAEADLFGIDKYVNFDYQGSKPLVDGELKPWMGFRFLTANLGDPNAYPESAGLFKPSTVNRLPVIVPSGVHHETWVESFVRVTAEMPTKKHSMQIYVEAESATVRTDEAKAWFIETKPAA